MIRRVLDRLARAWMLRKGAQWRTHVCRTCIHAEIYDDQWRDDMGDGFCYERNNTAMYIDDEACPAWQRKEKS